MMKENNWAQKSEAELYSCFTFSVWKRLTPEERMAAAQEVENRQAAMSGRPASRIEAAAEMGPCDLGCYYHNARKIQLNGRYFTDFGLASAFTPGKLLETILHEGRHAYQYHLALDASTHSLASDLLKAWKVNISGNGYISPEENIDLYFQQSIERDARMFALQEVRRISTVIQPDRQFLAAVELAKERECRLIEQARRLFPTLEKLDAFEKDYMTRISSDTFRALRIDPQTFHFFSETRAILEMSYHGRMKPEAIFDELQKSFFTRDYDLTVRLYDRLLRERPGEYALLQKQKMEAMDRNRRWQELLSRRGPLCEIGRTLEKPVHFAAYRISV